jgi:hypothetical protein
MAIRTLTFTATPDGITPVYAQKAGVSGEHNATNVVMDLSEKLITALSVEGAVYRFEIVDGLDQYDTTENFTLSAGATSVNIDIPNGWTAAGQAELRLVIAQLDIDSNEELVLYSFPCRLLFEGRDTGTGTTQANLETGLSGLIADTNVAITEANLARDNANTAKSAAFAAADEANTAAETANTAASNADNKAFVANMAANNASTNAALADTATKNANTATANANNAAAAAIASKNAADTAEGLRATAEQNRSTAEEQRAISESSRSAAEGERATAETAREAAEDIRIANEIVRNAHITNTDNPHSVTAEQVGTYTKEETNTALQTKADKTALSETNLRIATLDKDLSDYQNAIASTNPNQEAKQTAFGYGTVSLPVNAANGQISARLLGHTVTDESGTNSTVSAGRLRSFNKNLVGYNNSLPYTSTGVTMTYSDGKYTLAGTSTGYPFKSIFTIPANTLKGTYRLSKTTISGTDTAYIRIIDRTVTPAVPYSESVYATPFTMNGIHNELQVEIACTTGVTYNESFYLQLEPGTTATSYEPYTTADQYYPDCGLLRSLPNGTNDEVSFNQQTGQWEWIKRNGVKTNVASGTVINYADMATGGEFIAYYADGATQTGVKGDTLTALAVELTYQLASPIVTPIDVTGTLVGHPNGTAYWEPVLPVAGVYTSTGIAITNTSFPIESIESISKIDFQTGVETEVDISKAVIAVDGLSFTHPDLTADDIVFFTYFHGVEGTQPKIDVEYYDSRYVLKDSVTGKFYKIVETVANATLTRTLVEV